MSINKESGLYEVLSPWAEVDPTPLKGIVPRVADLARKKIGLFYNSKRAAYPTLIALEKKLKEKYHSIEISWYKYSKINVPEIETEARAKFEDWIQSVDAVILAYGD